MDTNLVMKGLMGCALGVTFVTLLFFAPRGWALTLPASSDKVERKPGATHHGARGPRYVFIGGYYGGGK